MAFIVNHIDQWDDVIGSYRYETLGEAIDHIKEVVSDGRIAADRILLLQKIVFNVNVDIEVIP